MKIFKLKLNNKTILILGIVLYVIVLTAITWFKYHQFGYNSMDLAIINNSFFNASQGNGFWSSVQGNYYFAYHFSPILYLILPFYWLWRSPQNLLLLQSLILGLSAWPVYLLAKKIINEKTARWISLAWLINPLLININLYEWHALSLAVPLLLTTYYFYHTNRLGLFTIFMLLSLTVREDVFIVIVMLGIMAIIEKRNKFWIIIPSLTSIAYAVFSFWNINSLSMSGSRFIVYYQWFFQSSVWEIILHLFKFNNIEMVVALTLAFLFLPWLKPKYLLLCLGLFLQYSLLIKGGYLVSKIHYSALFIPGLLIASLWGLKKIYEGRGKLPRFLKYDLATTRLVVIMCLIYLLLFLGPGFGIIKKLTENKIPRYNTNIITKIPTEAVVASGFKFLPWLSSRAGLYSLYYIITGKQQFSDQNYIFKPPDYIIITSNDIISFYIRLSESKLLTNLKKIVSENYGLIYYDNQQIIWEKQPNGKRLESEIDKQLFLSNNQFSYYPLAPIDIYLNKQGSDLKILYSIENNLDQDYFLEVNIDGQTFFRPLTLLTPTSQWQDDIIYSSLIHIPTSSKKLNLKLISANSHFELSGWQSFKNVVEYTTINSQVTINLAQ